MLAQFARDQFKLEKIVVVTSPNPPHRHEDLLDAEKRYELVELACRDNPFFEASRIELERVGPSYTVDTVRDLKKLEGPDCRLNLIVGQDNLQALRSWHDADDLFSLARILVASFEIIDFMQLPVSSSLVRERIRSNKTIQYIVPTAVRELIEKRGHYLLPVSSAVATSYPGIPDNVTLDFVKQWVKPRNSEKRFRHIKGVVQVARDLAIRDGSDPFLAEMGGWLHDACKEWKESKLVEMAQILHVPFGPIERQQGHLLHGPVAAAIAEKELGITNRDLLAAIAEHTLGNVPMTRLSEIVFLADCLEAGRSAEYTAPIWEALDVEGELDFGRAIMVATELGMEHLIASGRPIHPRAVDVRNHYLARLKTKAASSKSA